ncbi:MAG: anti-sigma factor domain-containing protein [Aeromicrobium sp.]
MIEIHALSGAFVLDAVDDIERAGFERHLGSCEECSNEVPGLCEAAARLADLTEAAPPPHLRAKVLAQARSARPLPPVGTPSAQPRRRLPALVAAAAAIVALGAGAGVGIGWHPWQERQTVQLSLADRVLQAGDAESWTREIPGGKITVTRSKSVGTAVMSTVGLPVAPTGKVYEFWLQKPDKSLAPAGLATSGTGEFVLRGDAATAVGAGLTVEPAGGSAAPTTDPLALFDFRAPT